MGLGAWWSSLGGFSRFGAQRSANYIWVRSHLSRRSLLGTQSLCQAGGTFSSTYTHGLRLLGGSFGGTRTRGLLNPWDLAACMGILRRRVYFDILRDPARRMELASTDLKGNVNLKVLVRSAHGKPTPGASWRSQSRRWFGLDPVHLLAHDLTHFLHGR
jgi:hypothetical protein